MDNAQSNFDISNSSDISVLSRKQCSITDSNKKTTARMFIIPCHPLRRALNFTYHIYCIDIVCNIAQIYMQIFTKPIKMQFSNTILISVNGAAARR